MKKKFFQNLGVCVCGRKSVTATPQNPPSKIQENSESNISCIYKRNKKSVFEIFDCIYILISLPKNLK